MDTCVVGPEKNWLRVGDRLRFHRDTNRMRRHVSGIINDTEVALSLYLRPSKGFRRHLRRVKRLQRTKLGSI